MAEPNETVQNTIITLLGEKVKTKSEEEPEVDVSSLLGAGKVVGLYFSAHWCPPCRAFTPQLSQWYQMVKNGPNGGNFEIVFVSSDRDEKAFHDYYKEMPWLALEYAKRETKTKLSTKFKVTGIPTLVFLDGENGALITTDGRAIVLDDKEGKNFPWKPKPFAEIIPGNFINNKEETTAWSDLKGKIIGLYFSAHWCGPCRAFTPNLIKTYNKIKEDGKDFEIIFVSSDHDEDAFEDYFGSMPWLAIPFDDKMRKKQLSQLFGISGIPSLVILDGNGQLITASGRSMVTADKEGTEFPWYPKPVNKLSGNTAAEINDSAALVWFSEDTTKEEEMKQVLDPLAKEHIEKHKDKDTGKELIFYYAFDTDEDSDNDIVSSLKAFCGLPQDARLAIINIPEQCVHAYSSDDSTQEITEDVIKKFIENFVSESLESKKIGQ